MYTTSFTNTSLDLFDLQQDKLLCQTETDSFPQIAVFNLWQQAYYKPNSCQFRSYFIPFASK